MIYVGRYRGDLVSPDKIEQIPAVSNFGVRWNVYKHGLQRMEFNVRTRPGSEAYLRYTYSQGERMAAHGPRCYTPVSGWVSEVVWLSRHMVKYIVKGAAWRGLRNTKINDEYGATDTVSATLTSILSNYSDVDSGNTAFIATNTTQLEGWQPPHPAGAYAEDLIPQLLNKSDSNAAIYDFYYVDEPLDGVTPQLFTPVYAARSSSATINWRVRVRDLKRITLARNIDERATTARVYHGMLTGTATGGSHTQLQDSSATFQSDGVRPDDQVTHITAGGRDRVVSVDSETQLTLNSISAKVRGTATGGNATTLSDSGADFVNDGVRSGDKVFNDTDGSTGTATAVTATTVTCSGGFSGGSSNAFTSGDKYRVASRFSSGDDYAIRTRATTNFEEYTLPSFSYWAREIVEFEPTMGQTAAAQYAEVLAQGDPVQVQSFVISAPRVRGSNYEEWDLFDIVARGGGYIIIEDLYPQTALFSTSRDARSVFFITALDYDGARNELRVQVDNPDRRLDVRLRRANILSSEAVQRGA